MPIKNRIKGWQYSPLEVCFQISIYQKRKALKKSHESMPRAEEHLKHGVRSYNYYLGYVCMDVPDKQFTLTNTSSTNSFLSMDKKEQT